MTSAMHDLLNVALSPDATPEDIANTPLPESMRAAVVRADEVDMFDGVDSSDKDPRKSLHVDEVDLPPLGPNEVLIAPMASALNFNTVWTSIFEPMSTFGFLKRFGREGELGAVDGGVAENRPILVDEADAPVRLHQPEKVGLSLLAEGAVVIEEGDDGQVALRVARDRRLRVIEDGVLVDALGEGLFRVRR